MEPLRRRKPAQTHPHHHHYYRSSKDTKHQPSPFHYFSISNTSIIRYCVKFAGLKAVFRPTAKPADGNDRPIHSVWYGHASVTPDDRPLPSAVYDHSPLGVEKSFEWIEKAAVASITPLVPCGDPRGRNGDLRRRSLEEIPVTVVQLDEDLERRESVDGKEVSGEMHP